MSRNLKFENLQIPKCSRDTSNSTVSKFFSQNNQVEKTASDIKETKLSISQPENISLELNQLNKIKEGKSTSESSFQSVLNVEFNALTERCIQNDCQISEDHEKPESKNEKSQLTSLTLKRKTSSTTKNTIKKFFNESGTDGDFVTPSKQQKKTFTSSKLNDQQQKKKEGIKKRKRQPKINNMLLRNEMMFSKMITQQSIAENINPDDMQLALALSRSEIETNHTLEYRDDECNMSDLENSTAIAKDSPMNINKLKGFKFKASRLNNANNDNDFNLFIPNKFRGKWANRFTPLTLRNPDRQRQKLLENVEKILSKQEQFDTDINFDKEKLSQQRLITITSDYLKDLISDENQIFYKCSLCDDDLSSYYVTDLFTPTTVKAGYLLKDPRKIPGREPSPEPFIISNQSSKYDVSRSMEEDQQQQNQKIFSLETHVYSASVASSSNDLDVISSSQTKNNENSENEKNNSRISSPDLFADYDEIHTEDNSKELSTSCETAKVEIEEEITDLEENGKNIDRENNLEYLNQMKNNPDSKLIYHNDLEKESDEWSQQLAIEGDSENHGEVEQPIADKTRNKSTVSMNNNPIKDDNFIDLTEDCSLSKSENESESDSSIIVTGEYKSNENLNFCNTSRRSPVRQSLHRSFSAIYSKDECNSIQNFEINQQKEFSNLRSSSFQKCTSEINFHSISKNEDKKNRFTVENSSQNNSQNASIDDCIIILSDDEVNYSIRKIENKIFESNIDNYEDVSDSKLVLSNINRSISVDSDISQKQKIPNHDSFNTHNFSLLDFISEKNEIYTELGQNEEDDDILDNSNQKIEEAELELTEIPFDSPNKEEINKEQEQDVYKRNTEEFNDSFFDLKKLKTEFGILNEKTPIKMKKGREITITSDHACRKSLSESFLKPSTSSSFVNKKLNETKSFQRFSNSKKFEEFIHEDFNDFDEFDKLVYGSPTKNAVESPRKPQGLEKLLTGDINMTTEEITREEEKKEAFTEIECDGKIFLVQSENVPEKPDYQNMDLPTLHKELSNYGVKPLKRKQAIIMLEYIYNQTHVIVNDFDSIDSDKDDRSHNNKRKNKDTGENLVMSQKQQEKDSKKKGVSRNKEEKYNNLDLKDCFGDILSKTDEILPEINNEEYFLPTNMHSKVLTAPLPLHIAWFNLVKSNVKLRESLLHYEPIDLQEIYLFFKKIGYRYNPKDMKKFFDSRCIIFRYDLCEGNNNRHTRKLLPRKPR